MSNTQDAARTIAEKLEYFAAEGARPDEWLLKEWAGILRNALAAPGAEAAAPEELACLCGACWWPSTRR